MDLSDDIAYSVHDLEDGVVGGRIELSWLRDPGRRREVWQTVREWYLPTATDEALDAALGGLRGMASWPEAAYDGSRGSQAGLKNLTSDLIGRFCTAAQNATHDRYGHGALTRYEADLVVPEATALEIATLKGVAAHYVMRAEDRVGLLQRQQEVVSDLVRVIAEHGAAALEPAFRDDLARAGSDAEAMRVVVDQVASLTDASALAWHDRLVRSGG
jgi:dGTPase